MKKNDLNLETIKLNDVKYAITQQGGIVGYHFLFIVKKDKKVYFTPCWNPKEIIPSNTIDAEYIGIIEEIPQTIPNIKTKIRGICDAIEYEIFDENLSNSIYFGLGFEKEINTFLNSIELLYQNSKILKDSKKNL